MKYNFSNNHCSFFFFWYHIFSEQKIPRLDPSVVRSALDSIRTERENDRKRKLRKKSKTKRHHKRHRRDLSHHENAKVKNISLTDNGKKLIICVMYIDKCLLVCNLMKTMHFEVSQHLVMFYSPIHLWYTLSRTDLDLLGEWEDQYE